MDYLPLNVNVQGRPVLVVGGGDLALRKAKILNRSGAVLTIVAPKVIEELRTLADANAGRVFERSYQLQDLHEVCLVVAATDDMALNETVSADAKAANIWVNIVDQPHLCNVIFPAVIDRSPIVISLSSGGSSPMMLRKLKAQLETQLPSGLGRLAKFLGANKTKVKQAITQSSNRLRFWEQAIDGAIAEDVYAGNEPLAQQRFDKLLSNSVGAQQGEVYLIGAGPGDADLLTFKALRLMQKADVVLYDRLVSDQILRLCRVDADMVYVGKARSDHAVPQADMNQMLVDLALEGKRVVRLKGGDPFIFGRGGEEIALLAENNISFQVVPGITAASGCAAYAGIPLTHRDYAQSVRFLTGHLKADTPNLNWVEMVHRDETLVFYMGLVGLPLICEGLLSAGRSPDTPIAMVHNGTRPDQVVVTGTLSTMVAEVAKAKIKAPTLIIVGEVVKLREQLSWFKQED
ncbi:MAG: uroporphyrin-III C-methyltransferase/precorrin-2 dehydrogenase/sirohydrochlorin ferrochelatase [Porticoccus sp.]|jgi:uroporphyrin-III C-methyltransferase/precorrin-2 dehydrogenase/sirohydrochlorin ferrochelatase